MRIFFLIAIISLFGSCIQERNISRIEVTKVDFEITSVFSVDCTDFEAHFEKDVSSVVIADKPRMESFEKIIAKLEPDQKNYIPDVRAKILIYYTNSKTDTLCLSNMGVLLNGKSYLGNNSLTDFVNEAR